MTGARRVWSVFGNMIINAMIKNRPVVSTMTGRHASHLVTGILCLLFFLPAWANAQHKIAIVSIDEEVSTTRTIKGIKKSFLRSGLKVEYRESVFSGHPENDAKTLKELGEFEPELFITIGSYATLKTAEAFPQKPVVFATVINPISSGFINSMSKPGGNITGATLDIPADKQFYYFQRVVGNIKKMGVIYSSETESIIADARIAARKRGIELIAMKINNERDVPGAIDSLCGVADALWSVADHTIYTPQSTKHIILQTLRHRIPMMGFSQALVEAGGLFTLDFDFKDIGRQAGEIAAKVLAGSAPGSIPVATPGVIYFKYNEKTAGRIKIDIPEDLLAIAKEVVK